jgi:hypothetical protein
MAGDDSLQSLPKSGSSVTLELVSFACRRICEIGRPLRCGARMNSHRTMVLLHHHLKAFRNLGQHGMDVAREFGFCNEDAAKCNKMLRETKKRRTPKD